MKFSCKNNAMTMLAVVALALTSYNVSAAPTLTPTLPLPPKAALTPPAYTPLAVTPIAQPVSRTINPTIALTVDSCADVSGSACTVKEQGNTKGCRGEKSGELKTVICNCDSDNKNCKWTFEGTKVPKMEVDVISPF